MFRSDRHEAVKGRSAEESAHKILSCVCVLCSGQMDTEKAKAGLQSSQHTVLCLYIVFGSDRHEEVEGRSAE